MDISEKLNRRAGAHRQMDVFFLQSRMELVRRLETKYDTYSIFVSLMYTILFSGYRIWKLTLN